MIYHVYAGSYMGSGGGEGIYLLELDTEKRTLVIKESYPEWSKNPSYMAVTADVVYVLSELSDCGFITAFKRNRETGALTRINRIKTQGTSMCHLNLWPDKKHISASNYMSGSLLVCRINEDGSLGEVTDFKQHEGVGVEKEKRQNGPHVHSTGVSRDGKRLYAADLGLDQVFCYDIGVDGTLSTGADSAQIHTRGGDGPRHFAMSKDGGRLYLSTEMGSRLYVFQSGDGGKTYVEVQSVSSLKTSYEGFNIGADIHLSVDEKYVFFSNRGEDDIAVFPVKPDGKVGRARHYLCGGLFPRCFCITPDGDFILIANQKSGNIALFEVDRQTGAISGKLADVGIPQVVYVNAVEKGN